LQSTIPPVTAPAWTTSITGVNPGKHSVFQFTEFYGDTYNPHLLSSTSIKSKTIFEILSGLNIPTIAFNVPLTYPPFPINGNLVSGMNATKTTKGFTYPTELEEELNQVCDGYYPDIDLAYHLHKKKGEKFKEDLLDILVRRKKAVLHLMKNKDWRFFMAVFTETDRASHFFWDKLNLNKEDEEDFIFQIYNELDKLIGDILNELTPEDNFMIISDHGFEEFKYKFNVHKWLEENTFLCYKIRKKKRIKFDFIKEFASAEIIQDSTNSCRIDEYTINYDTRKVIFAHPYNIIRFKFKVPFRSSLIFSITTDPNYWENTPGDGVIFKVRVRSPESNIDDEEGWRYLYTRMINPKLNKNERCWIEEKIDLFEFSGKELILEFVTNPNEMNQYNNTVWGEPYIRGFWGGEKEISKVIDWNKTTAYQMDQGGIFINLKGREASGIIKKTEYKSICNEIKRKLIDFSYNGKKIFTAVKLRDEEYTGKYLKFGPDILYVYNEGFWQEFWQKFPELVTENIDDPESFSGKHKPEGIIFVYGKDIKKIDSVLNLNIKDV
ncbi:alkaline phosphatase family protein, partial [Candidatus Dependentiae bacterium]|nr:alkaline phosphatase family protein [Candidatus Dependentiae bacterium]